MQQTLAARVVSVSAGDDQWFVACSDGHIYAFTMEGRAQWNHLVPYAPRDHSTNAEWGLPLFHPRLHLTVDGPILAVGAGQELHCYSDSGDRLWSAVLPQARISAVHTRSTDLPTRDDRLSKLGLARTAGRQPVQTAYLRLKLDTVLNSGYLKQVEISDFESSNDVKITLAAVNVQIGSPLQTEIRAVCASGSDIAAERADPHLRSWRKVAKNVSCRKWACF